MRIFVGTLACGEAELDDCRQAVARQTGVQVRQLVIENRPELEAHNALWDAWNAERHQHDLFVKVDADTVLMRDTALAEIGGLFEDPDVTGAQILLQDYFTDNLIAGLNSFSGAVKFHRSNDRLFTDRVDYGHVKVMKGPPVAHLAPIGWHCLRPHARQAFHFGLHRALKKQNDVIGRVAEVWLRERDDARGWALAGAASAGFRFNARFDYSDKNFERKFDSLNDPARRADLIEHFARRVALRSRGKVSP
ncbi:MAG: hypothetical protein ACOYLQ_15960 [Hyphomicrobiaceae bacterium]